MRQTALELLKSLSGKDLIAYGTGRTGKVVIPYLAQQKDIKLYGVTNSRIDHEDAGTYLNTGLPIRSIQAWSKLMPDATILVTIENPTGQKEILDICKRTGFHKIQFISFELIHDIAYSDLAIHALPQEDNQPTWIRPAGNPWLSLMCLAHQVYETHKATFSEFRGCHKGEMVAVVGTGPSLNYYAQIEGIPHIGVNTAFKRKGIKLDYYFLGHYIPDLCADLKKYNFEKFITFFDEFPEYIIEENHARRYFINYPSQEIHTDIGHYPLMGAGSIIFSAIQFALYTRPKKLFLIGCDCAANGHFDTKQEDCYMESAVPIWRDGYKRLRHFATQYYPDTEIVSVNPVGLKGMFSDVYTESYLNAYPELDQDTCEILSDCYLHFKED